jgi:squalene-hopene/tetraprenyl-beta-curcumene cyclase
VPDADDTAGALVALHILTDGQHCPEVSAGLNWLLDLQNADGGMPTFCKGWGKLPFDRSSADISAHALLAIRLWEEALPDEALRRRCARARKRLLRWMRRAQAADGSWTPLWFGDQDAPDEKAPVYGTATTVDYLAGESSPIAANMVEKGLRYLLSAQNADGGWGGQRGVASKVCFTARALSALASYPERVDELRPPACKAVDFLFGKFERGELYRPEPIGLYFSRLWYSEVLYAPAFAYEALRKFHSRLKMPLHASNATSRGLETPLHACNATISGDKAPLHACNATISGDKVPLHACNALMSGDKVPLHACNAIMSGDKVPLHACNAIMSGDQTLMQEIR